tara:strand:- start:152231 stop:153217 length:987 start_codon:yes stop_codon:yes gene_type:complete
LIANSQAFVDSFSLALLGFIMKNFLIILLALYSGYSLSSEIDSFTNRYQPLENSVERVNFIANEFLDKAIINANKKDHACKEKKLYKAMRKYFKNHISGEVTVSIQNDEQIDKRLFHVKESVYRDFKWWNSFVLMVVGRLYDGAHGAVINFNDHLIGTDKFEHMFGRGFLYFKRYYLKGKKLKKVLKYGAWQENWTLGSKTTGIFSYADQAANFNGMRFWNHILQKRKDYLGENHGPLVKCQENKWVKIKDLDFTPFIDDSMDEGHNCSMFSTKKLTKSVIRQIKKLEEADGLRYTCPIRSDVVNILNEKYGSKLAPYLLNFRGHLHR